MKPLSGETVIRGWRRWDRRGRGIGERDSDGDKGYAELPAKSCLSAEGPAIAVGVYAESVD